MLPGSHGRGRYWSSRCGWWCFQRSYRPDPVVIVDAGYSLGIGKTGAFRGENPCISAIEGGAPVDLIAGGSADCCPGKRNAVITMAEVTFDSWCGKLTVELEAEPVPGVTAAAVFLVKALIRATALLLPMLVISFQVPLLL